MTLLNRFVVIAALSVFCTACGGGGGGGTAPPTASPPPSTPPSVAVAITEANALQAAGIAMVLPGATLQLADLATDTVRTVLSRTDNQFTEVCDGGGDADYVFVDTNLDGIPGDGDSIGVTYRSCLISQFQQTGSGSITLTFVEPSQAWTSEDKFFQGSMDATQLTTEVQTAFQFHLHFGLLEELTRVSGDVDFVVNVDGVDYSEKLEGFSVAKHADFESARNEIAYSGKLVSDLLGGFIIYDTNSNLSGFLNTYPEQGRFEIEGANGSRAAVVPYDVPNSTLAEVRYDVTGGGTFVSLDDQEFWSSFTPDFTWSYSPTSQQYIRPYDQNDFWFIGGSPIGGDVIPVQSSLRLQFAREVDSSTVPAAITVRRDLNEPPFIETYEAATDIRGAAVILRPLEQLRHGSNYNYPSNTVTVSDRSGNTASACCERFATRANLAAVAEATPFYGLSQTNIELDGSSSTTTGATIAAYSWRQLTGTPSMISNSDRAVAGFQIPAVPLPELLELQLQVSDANGELAWDTVGIHAFPDAASISLLSFYGDQDDYVSIGRDYFLSSATGSTSVERDSYNGIRFQSGSWNLFFVAPGDTDIEVGNYENAVRYQTIGSSNPELSIFGDGRSCNTSTGRFDVLEVEYDANGNVLVAAIDFEQYCDGTDAKLTGHLRVGSNAAVPAKQ